MIIINDGNNNNKFYFLAIELTAPGRWFIMMNFFVHSIMYAYYSITVWGVRLPKLLSMFVTVLQTSQMLIGVLISIVALKQKLTNAVSYTLSLFLHFYESII